MVLMIIIVFGFGMFNMLVMIVMEKIKDIVILCLMGFMWSDIGLIFML